MAVVMASDASLCDAGTVAGVSGCGGRGATRSGAWPTCPSLSRTRRTQTAHNTIHVQNSKLNCFPDRTLKPEGGAKAKETSLAREAARAPPGRAGTRPSAQSARAAPVDRVREDAVSGAKGLRSSGHCQARGRRRPQDTVSYGRSPVLARPPLLPRGPVCAFWPALSRHLK